MKRSAEPLQVWTSPYAKVPQPPTRRQLAETRAKTFASHIRSALRTVLQEIANLLPEEYAARFFARFRHSV